MQAVPNRPQKVTVDPAASNNDTLVDSVVTVFPVHKEWIGMATAHTFLGVQRHGERVWFKPLTRTQTPEHEYSDLTASNRRQSTPYVRNTRQNFAQGTRW